MKKILYFSSTRADFGIMKSLLKKIDNDNEIDLFLIISGTHHHEKFGNSYEDIKKYNFKNCIDIKINNKEIEKIDKSLNIISSNYTEILKQLKPDAVMILGDRFEVAQIALLTHILNYPLIHFHGGEKTSGSKDDNYRHLISKISQFHFVSSIDAQKRLIQLGENKKNIFIIGSLSLEQIDLNKSTYNSILNNFHLNLQNKKFFLITIHPSLSLKKTKDEINVIAKSIVHFKNIDFIFTSPNQDPGFNIIFDKINFLTDKYINIHLCRNFGQNDYFYMVKKSLGVIGNSSSGVLEVPFFKVPTINLGNRQKGRHFSTSVINIDFKSVLLSKTIDNIINNKTKIDFSSKNILLKRNASNRVLNFIKKMDFSRVLLTKNFIDKE